MTIEGETVLTRDRSSGVVHKRVQLEGGLATFEGCNLDAAGAYEIVRSLDELDDPILCQRCFPAEPEAPETAELEAPV